MDEFDDFDDGPSPGPDGFDDALGDEGPSSGFDVFDEAEVPDETDLDGFDFDTPGEDGDLDADLDGAFDVDAEFDDEPAPDPGDEAAYASTYEDMLVAEADNPAVFPPELDLDVPEPVDGYPWVDLDSLGQTETEPWADPVDASAFAAADLDDIASETLSRFWES